MVNSALQGSTRFDCIAASPKIPRAKALVAFSRYGAAQEAARYEEGLRLDKTDRLLSSTVCERCRLLSRNKHCFSSGGCGISYVPLHFYIPAALISRPQFKNGGGWALRSRLENQPTDLRRRHYYVRDGALDWTS